jgi:outer membrane protein OmpA-like peptidoglycan-associated protein
MKSRILSSALLTGATLSFIFSGCATPGKRTAIGTGVGATVGAGIGAATGGGKGAAIGAMAGGLLGGSVGNYLDKQAHELSKVADTQRTANGILVNLKNDLLFETNSSVLTASAIQQLNDLADVLVKYPDDRIVVSGYTDSIGSATYNRALSERRAAAVQNVLSARGVTPVQMIVQGLGESSPIASNSTVQGRAQNRRVELHIDVPQRTASQQR